MVGSFGFLLALSFTWRYGTLEGLRLPSKRVCLPFFDSCLTEGYSLPVSDKRKRKDNHGMTLEVWCQVVLDLLLLPEDR